MELRSHSATRNLIELVVGYGLILTTLWSAPPARAFWGSLASFWVVIAVLLEARSQCSLGLGAHGFRESLWAFWLAVVVSALTIWCAAALKTLHYHYVPRPYPPMSGYLIWAFVQQFILQNFFLSRLLRLVARPWLAIGFAGMLMGMAHLPNPLLVGATLLWGAGACWLFVRYRNLYVLGLIHFLLGITLAVCVPSSIQHNMRVGRGYWKYHQAQLRARPRSALLPSAVVSPRRRAE